MPDLDDAQVATLNRAIDEGKRQLAEAREDLAAYFARQSVPADRLFADVQRRLATIHDIRGTLIELVSMRDGRAYPK